MLPLAELLAALDASSAEGVRLAESLSEEQFRWQPAPTSWSVGHCLQHLAVTDRVYVDAMRRGAAGAAPRANATNVLAPGFFGRWFVREMEPPPKRRLPAPAKVVPELTRAKAEVIAEFTATQAELREFAASCASIDVNRTRFANPFLPVIRFSLATSLLLTAAHHRRHLFQARNVVARAEFPR